MRLLTRRTARAAPGAGRCVATYAALVGDRVLWVATPEPAQLVLVPTSGGPARAPDGLDEGQPGHHGFRFDLAGLSVQAGPHELRTAHGHPVVGPPVGGVAAGAQLALTRDDAHALHVVRRPVPPGPTLRAVRLLGDRVHLRLECAAGPPVGEVGALELLDGDTVVASLPVDPVDGGVELAADDLVGLEPGERTLSLRVAGQPVRRRANDLADPGAGALLPALHPAGAPAARARLRWSADATLVLRLLGAP